MNSLFLKRLPLLVLAVFLTGLTLAAAGCGCGGCTSCDFDSCDLDEILDQVTPTPVDEWRVEESPPPDEPETAGEPDLFYLEDALYYFIISTYDVRDLYLIHEAEVPGPEEPDDWYGDDTVIVYRYADQGSTVVVDLGEPFSEYSLQVTLSWDGGDWVVEDVKDIGY